MDKDTAVKTIMSLNNMTVNEFLKFDNARKLADFIEQQAQQIEKMKCCDNCKKMYNYCEVGTCKNYENWEWDGGSGD